MVIAVILLSHCETSAAKIRLKLIDKNRRINRRSHMPNETKMLDLSYIKLYTLLSIDHRYKWSFFMANKTVLYIGAGILF
jgi:hypothetical protein